MKGAGLHKRESVKRADLPKRDVKRAGLHKRDFVKGAGLHKRESVKHCKGSP